LDSIIPQLNPDVEVIILDGGSIDDTAQVVSRRSEKCKNIYFYHQEFRGGIAQDIDSLVDLANGDYIWLFSADDIMLPGSIDKILCSILTSYDIYLCESILCSFDMKPIKRNIPLKGVNKLNVFDFSNFHDKLLYFSSANTTEAFFSYLSGPIFKKDIWIANKSIAPLHFQTVWIVSLRLMNSFLTDTKICYLGEILIHKRGDNDSFLEGGYVKRYALSINGFQEISSYFFQKDTIESFHIRRALRNDITLSHFLNLKNDLIKESLNKDLRELNDLVYNQYSDSSILNSIRIVVYFYIPIWLYSYIKVLFGFMKKTIKGIK